MNHSSHRKFTIDILFVITVFCLFAICSILLITVGAKVYQNTLDNMETHFSSTTSLAYITEKIRQNDRVGKITIDQFGSGDALVLFSEYNGEEYCTYIYTYGGCLKELFTKKNLTLSPEAGRDILDISDFSIVSINDGLYEITLVDAEHKSDTILIAQKARKDS